METVEAFEGTEEKISESYHKCPLGLHKEKE